MTVDQQEAVNGYLASVDPGARTLAAALDAVIRSVRPDFDVAVKYRLLMYALAGDWRHWVCAIDAQPRRVSLRFLYGVMLADPRHVLRPGSSVLATWDFAPSDTIAEEAVRAYVAEAAERYSEFRANDAAILAESRAAAASRRPAAKTPRPRG